MKSTILFVVLGVLLFSVVNADEKTLEHSGSINTSVNAIDKEGYDCAVKKGGKYLLETMPKFFASEFGKSGLLKESNNGKYRVVLEIGSDSNLKGYQVAPGTDENSPVIQAILNMKNFPLAPKNATCLTERPFIYEFTFK